MERVILPVPGVKVRHPRPRRRLEEDAVVRTTLQRVSKQLEGEKMSVASELLSRVSASRLRERI